MTEPQTPKRRTRDRKIVRRRNKQRILIIIATVLGVAILLYPTAAAWFSDRVHATEISGYVDAVQSISPTDQDVLLDEARKFNAELPSGPLRDPYSLNDNGETTVVGAGSDAYKKLLDIGPGGMMGRISVPSIHADLPIFHGTDEETLAKGAGHLFGSALPVGGTDTHSVITAHSGFVNATLFDNLDKVAEGDTFSVTVLGQTVYYKVNQIKTVLPEETDDLRKVPGEDLITLVTCTPKGINTHRLLVTGERIDAPSGETTQTLPSQALDPGFPWWALAMVGATVLIVLVTRPRKSPTETSETIEETPGPADALVN